MKIQLTAGAYQDLEDLYNYIADKDSVTSAEYVAENIKKQVESLANFPNRGNFVKELLAIGNKNYKEVYFKPYRIIYRVKNEDVFIFIIADGRRDLKTLLEKRLLGGCEK